MGKLRASECGADHRDSAGALGHTAPTYRGFIRPELRTGTLASLAVPAGEVALQDSDRGRVLPTQRISIEQGYSKVLSTGGYRAVYRAMVELDWDAGTERPPGSL